MSDINVIVEEIDNSVIVEVNPINDEVTVVIGSVVNNVGGLTKHSELILDDGTNPHGTTFADVDDGFVAKTNEENTFTEDQAIEVNKNLILGNPLSNHTRLYNFLNETYWNVVDSLGATKAGLWLSGGSNKSLKFLPDATVDLGFNGGKPKNGYFSGYVDALGFTSVENDATKVFASDGSVVDLPTGGETKPTPYGYIYNKNSWTDVSDFTVEGNATAVISGSNINIGTTVAGSYDDIIRLDQPTGLGIYKQTIEIKVINTPVADSYGLGLGIRSRVAIPANAFQYVTRIDMSSGGNKGKMQFDYGDPNYAQVGSLGTAVSFSQNDILRITVEQDIDTIVAKVYNITTQEEQSIFYVYTLPSSPFTSNAGDFAIHILGGTYEMQLYKVETKAFKNSSLMCIGDSKTNGYNGASFAESFPNQLNGLLNYITDSSGGNETTSEVLIKIPEIIELSPKKVLLNIGSNDKRYGITYAVWESNYDSIVSQLEAAGIDVYHLLQLNENVLTFTDYNTHITSTYASTRIVDAGIISLYSDGVHPDYTGMDEIFMSIVSQIGDVI